MNDATIDKLASLPFFWTQVLNSVNAYSTLSQRAEESDDRDYIHKANYLTGRDPLQCRIDHPKQCLDRSYSPSGHAYLSEITWLTYFINEDLTDSVGNFLQLTSLVALDKDSNN